MLCTTERMPTDEALPAVQLRSATVARPALVLRICAVLCDLEHIITEFERQTLEEDGLARRTASILVWRPCLIQLPLM